jgi:hypothetical protein
MVSTSEYVDSGRGGYSSSTGTYGGGASNGRPRTVSLEAQTMFVMPARRAALATFQDEFMLLAKVLWSGTMPGSGMAARFTRASTES